MAICSTRFLLRPSMLGQKKMSHEMHTLDSLLNLGVWGSLSRRRTTAVYSKPDCFHIVAIDMLLFSMVGGGRKLSLVTLWWLFPKYISLINLEDKWNGTGLDFNLKKKWYHCFRDCFLSLLPSKLILLSSDF